MARLLLLLAILSAPLHARADAVWRGRLRYIGVQGSIGADMPVLRLRFVLRLPDADGLNRLDIRCRTRRACARLGTAGLVEGFSVEPHPSNGERVATMAVAFDHNIICRFTLDDAAVGIDFGALPVRTRLRGSFRCPQKIGSFRMRRAR